MDQNLFEAVATFLQADSWNPTQVEGKTILRMGFDGSSGMWNVFVQTKEENRQAMVYSVSSHKVPEDQRQRAAEFLTRANYGLPYGNFELDFSDGEVRFKTCIDVEGGTLTDTMIKNLMYANVSAMDRYQAGLLRVIFGDTSPAEAITVIESP